MYRCIREQGGVGKIASEGKIPLRNYRVFGHKGIIEREREMKEERRKSGRDEEGERKEFRRYRFPTVRNPINRCFYHPRPPCTLVVHT